MVQNRCFFNLGLVKVVHPDSMLNGSFRYRSKNAEGRVTDDFEAETYASGPQISGCLTSAHLPEQPAQATCGNGGQCAAARNMRISRYITGK